MPGREPASIRRPPRADEGISTTTFGYVYKWLVAIVLGLLSYPLLAFREPLAELKGQTLSAASALATEHFRAREREILGRNTTGQRLPRRTATGHAIGVVGTISANTATNTLTSSNLTFNNQADPGIALPSPVISRWTQRHRALDPADQ